MADMGDSNRKEKEYLPFATYVEHRKSLVETLQKQAQAFDKAILTLSSGALAFSLLFIEKVAPTPLGWTKVFLVLAWLLFTVSMLCTLYSFLTSQKSHLALIAEWDEARRTQCDPSDHKERDRHDRNTRYLNKSAAWTLIGGVFLLLIFAGLNFLENAK